MKKLICILIALISAVTMLTSCGGKKTPEAEKKTVMIDGKEYDLRTIPDQFGEVLWRYPKEMEMRSYSNPDSSAYRNVTDGEYTVEIWISGYRLKDKDKNYYWWGETAEEVHAYREGKETVSEISEVEDKKIGAWKWKYFTFTETKDGKTGENHCYFIKGDVFLYEIKFVYFKEGIDTSFENVIMDLVSFVEEFPEQE